jgi:PPOX class probable F420-dependent enzyme
MLTPGQSAFIESVRTAHLATADAGGVPHVIPVCFAYVNGDFWTVVDEKPKGQRRLKRLRNIDENPKVALVFDRYDEDWSRLGYVLVQGTARIVDGAPAAVLEALRERYPQYREMALEGREAIRVVVERVVEWGSVSG